MAKRILLGQISKVFTEMRNHNFILIKDEEAVSQEYWFDDKEEEESNEDEGEADLSRDKRESLLELKEAELVTKIIQGDERKLWNVINKEEEDSYVEFNDQLTDDVF